MLEADEKEANKWKQDPSEKASGGDACCSSGDLSPEEKIFNLIPKLN